jgi:acetoin utilization deacetylase AcuC-like enzyme
VAEFGAGAGEGFNLNLPLPYGTGDAGYERAMREVVVPLVNEFEPDLVIGAVGQDASQFDPNGRQNVTMSGFRVIGELVRSIADGPAGGRLALIQDGGSSVGLGLGADTTPRTTRSACASRSPACSASRPLSTIRWPSCPTAATSNPS